MDAAPTLLARNMALPAAAMRPDTQRARAAALPGLNGTDADRPSHSSPWGSSIWNSTSPIGLGFTAAVRDSSRSRENNAYRAAPTEYADSKTGSGSLVADSESEWRTRWADRPSANTPQARSSAVSPARKRSIASQSYTDASASSFYPGSRASAVGQGAVSPPAKPLLDPTSHNFSSTRPLDHLNASLKSFGFGHVDAVQHRADMAGGSWPDSTSIHSPSEAQSGLANADYRDPTSGAQSRSGSLPPSRHGVDSSQYGLPAESQMRFAAPGPRQPSSFAFAHHRPPQERSGSMQSESLLLLSHEHERSTRPSAHRPSMSIHGYSSTSIPTAPELHGSREGFYDPQLSSRPEHAHYSSNGTYTPDSYTNGQGSDLHLQPRFHQSDTRSAPNGTGVRQSPFYSNAHTPPVYDHLNPYRSEQALGHPNNLAMIQNKLVGYQIQQERRSYQPTNQYQQQQYHNMLPLTQQRHSYSYQFALANGLPLASLPGHINLTPILPNTQVPRGPRDQQTGDGVGAMSAKLAVFRRDVKQNKHWELSEICDHVVEFAGDQHGSRFIQQKLETANSDIKDRIFKELEQNALPLMQDVFGNYVIQKFFEHGDQKQKKILASKMQGHVVSLANQMYACRVVQKALEHVLVDQQAAIVKELEKDVIKTVQDQNGNHVIQKAIDRVPMEHNQGVVEAFRGLVGSMSVNAYGCRVVQRLLEKVKEPQRRFIVEELHAEGTKLFTHSYGNYVAQHVIEHGLPEDRERIVGLVKEQMLIFCRHKYASNVVERCLLCGSDEQRRQLLSAVTAKDVNGEPNFLVLLKDGFGNYVIQKLLETLSRADFDPFVAALKPELEKTKKSIPSKQTASVEKRMHRDDRIDSPTMSRGSTEIPPTPALSSSAQSPSSSTVPSAQTPSAEESTQSRTELQCILPRGDIAESTVQVTAG